MTPNFGIYQAIVTDNSQFFQTGKIRVRIQSYYNGKLNWDLSQNYDQTEFNENLIKDTMALVYTPIGGGNGHGMFALPQVNAVGLVQFMNGNIKQPIWMGSFFRPEYDQDGKLARVNVPNDIPEMEGSGSDGITQGENKLGEKRIEGDFGSVIIRTKTTSGPGKDGKPENMDFNEQRSENLIVFNKDKTNFTHFSKWDKDATGKAELKQWEEIELGTVKERNANGDVVDEYPEINIKVSEVKSKTNTKTLSVKINNDKVSLEVIDGDIITDLGVTGEGVEITSTNSKSKSSTSFEQTPEQIVLAGKDTSVTVEKDEVILSSKKKIRLSGKTIQLGNGESYIAAIETIVPNMSYELRDGFTIKACGNIKG